MLLIYAEQLSPRFSFIIKHIFDRMLGLEIKITTDLECFIKSDSYKLSYAKSAIGNEFFVKNFGLLYQKGVQNIDVFIEYFEGIPYFFSTKKGCFPFDIFSASFFLLSRYEEYKCGNNEKYENFSATESIAYKYNFLEIPIIDIWVEKFKKALLEKYPNLVFNEKKYTETSVIEVAKAFKYKHKGVVRSISRSIVDIFTLNFYNFINRLKVILGFVKDPFDIYDQFINFHKEKNIRNIFFFLLANYSIHDKGISYNNVKYKYLIKYMADYSIVSVLSSYFATFDIKEMKNEQKRMNAILNRSITRFKANNNILPLPDIYRKLTECEYKEDFSMGYTSHIGFRSGTCTPYFFYDIKLEVQLPVLVHSFCFHSQVAENQSEKSILKKINTIKQHIKNVKGNFIPIFSNEYIANNNFNFYKQIINL